jgi:hypothetical protein
VMLATVAGLGGDVWRHLCTYKDPILVFELLRRAAGPSTTANCDIRFISGIMLEGLSRKSDLKEHFHLLASFAGGMRLNHSKPIG